MCVTTLHACVEPFYNTCRGVYVCVRLHSSDINSRSCQWPLTGPVALSVSALMLGQGRRSEHRMGLQRHAHTHTHPPLLKGNDDSQQTPSPSSVPRPQEPKHSAEGGNSSWWQPSIVATPQAAHTTTVFVYVYCKLPVFICFAKINSVFYLFHTASMPKVKEFEA